MADAAAGGNEQAKTVARAWVQLKPSLRGFFTETNRELSGAKMTSLGRSIGRNIQNGINRGIGGTGNAIGNHLAASGGSAGEGFGKNFNKGFGGISTGVFGGFVSSINNNVVGAINNATSAITSFGTTTAKVAVGAGLALAGMTATGGFTRALNIENAQAKLVALKHTSSEVSSIMNSALESVNGTIYSLDGAAGAAANAVASGIPQGEKLTNWLKLITDTATVANAPLDDVARILNRVQANGRAFTLELNMLADRGIPIFTMLAQETGQSMTQLRKSIAAGEISVDTLANALQHKLGGAAMASANTTKGAFANMKIAFSRLGAIFATSVLPVTRQFFLEIRDTVDMIAKRFGPAIKAFGEKLSGWLAPRIAVISDKVSAFFDKVTAPHDGPTFLDTLKASFEGIKRTMSPVVDYFKGQFSKAFNTSTGIVTKLLNAMFVGTDKKASWLTDFVNGVRYVNRELQPVYALLKTYFPPMLARAEKLFKQLFASAFVDGKTSDSWLGKLVTLITTYVPKIISTILPIFDELWKKAFVGENGKASWVTILIDSVGKVLKILWPIVVGFVTTFLPMLIKGIGAILPYLGKFFVSLATIAGAVITSFGPVVMDLFQALAPLVGALVVAVINATPAIVSFIQTLGGIAKHLSGNHELVQALAVGFITAFSIFKGMGLVIKIVEGVGGAITGVVGTVTTFAGYLTRIVGIFGKIGGVAVRGARLMSLFINLNAVRGFASALGTMFPRLMALVGGVGRMVAAIKTWTIWTNIAKGAQAAFNFVASMNPWVLLTIAIIAVVGALVWFFTQTETGKQMWASFTTVVADSMTNIGKWFGEAGTNIAKAWDGAMKWISDTWNNTVKTFNDTVNTVGQWFSDVFTKIGTGFNFLMKGVSDGLGIVGNWFNGVFNGIAKFFTGLIDGVSKRIGDFVNWVLSLGGLIPEWALALGGNHTVNVNAGNTGAVKLPGMATGGDVMYRPGGTPVIVGEKDAETIVNRSKMNNLMSSVITQMNNGGMGGGQTHIEVGGITVVAHEGQDVRKLVDEIFAEIEFRSMR